MTKNVRKLQIEIDRSLKATEEVRIIPLSASLNLIIDFSNAFSFQGIIQLAQLNSKIETANSVQMKEKYESDMKKEMKKLQKIRDFFKQTMNSSEVKDKSKLQEARRRIEQEMEAFKEHEKEFKQNKLTKSAMQSINEVEGKFKFGSNDGSFDGEYDDSGEDSPFLSDKDVEVQ